MTLGARRAGVTKPDAAVRTEAATRSRAMVILAPLVRIFTAIEAPENRILATELAYFLSLR